MDGWKPEYSFLSSDERVIYALQASKTDFIVTNGRFVIQREGDVHEDFDLKYIAHMYTSVKNYKIYGAILIIIGLGAMVIYPQIIAVGGTIAALGVVLFLMKESKIIFSLSGVNKEFKYDVRASKQQINTLVSKVSEVRNKLSK